MIHICIQCFLSNDMRLVISSLMGGFCQGTNFFVGFPCGGPFPTTFFDPSILNGPGRHLQVPFETG